MKTLRVFLEEQKRKRKKPRVITGYATIRNDNLDEILAGIEKMDESFTFQHSVEHGDYVSEPEKHLNRILKSKEDRFERSKRFNQDKEGEYNRNLDAVEHHTLIDHPNNKHLTQYTDESQDLNMHLIKKHIEGKAPSKYRPMIKALDTELSRPENELKKKVVAYSGVGTNMARNLMEAKPEDHIHFPAYTSTSIHHDIAHEFSKYLGARESKIPPRRGDTDAVRHIAVFHLPPGYKKGRFIRHLSFIKRENEYLLNRNQKFKMFERRYDPVASTMYHHLEPVSDDEKV